MSKGRIYISKEEIDEKFKKREHPHIHALSGSYGYGDNIMYECDIHHCIWHGKLGSVLYKKYCCPECVKVGRVNSNLCKYNLFDIRPDVARLLENPNDAINCSENCKTKKWFICPQCGARLYKSVVVVSNFGLACNVCSDGFSFPNKLMFCFLNQLNVTFIPEYSPSWISPKRYDFYFNYNDKDYIVEMDGLLGHVIDFNHIYDMKGMINDNYKDNEALKHGIEVIRIDAKKSDFEYIKINIINSRLSVIFDLNRFDWDKCSYETNKNKLINVCKYYQKYPFVSYSDLSTLFRIKEDTCRKYLRIGYEQNLCPKYKTSYGKDNAIICLDSKMIFPNATEAASYYNLDSSAILKCCNQKQQQTFGLHFSYLSNFTGDIDCLVVKNVSPKFISNKRKINMYDKDYRFVKTFSSIEEASRETGKSLRNVIKSCKSKHKYNYGQTFYYADDPNQPDKLKVLL